MGDIAVTVTPYPSTLLDLKPSRELLERDVISKGLTNFDANARDSLDEEWGIAKAWENSLDDFFLEVREFWFRYDRREEQPSDDSFLALIRLRHRLSLERVRRMADSFTTTYIK